MKTKIFIEGDFKNSKTGKCKYHVWPSCHPAQVGPEDVFGCTHMAWPMNRGGDFCPIVDCGGDVSKCEFKTHKAGIKWAGYFKRSLTRRLHTARQKLSDIENAKNEFDALLTPKEEKR